MRISKYKQPEHFSLWPVFSQTHSGIQKNRKKKNNHQLASCIIFLFYSMYNLILFHIVIHFLLEYLIVSIFQMIKNDKKKMQNMFKNKNLARYIIIIPLLIFKNTVKNAIHRAWWKGDGLPSYCQIIMHKIQYNLRLWEQLSRAFIN